MTGPDQEFKPFSVVTVGTVADNRRGFIRPFYKLRPGVLSLRVCLFVFSGQRERLRESKDHLPK